MIGLAALGFTQDNALTRLGKAALGLSSFATPTPLPPWYLDGTTLTISRPCNLPLLWKLEQYLAPQAPGEYLLDDPALRTARQRGEPENLIGILEQGLRAQLPGDLHARILGQPTLKLSTVTVLECSSPAELRQLRRSPALRQHFEQILSPHHARIDIKDTPRVIEVLKRRGIHVFSPPQIDPDLPDEFGACAEQSRSEGPGMGSKRPHLSRQQVLQPLGNLVSLPEFLGQAIRQQTAIDVLYHAPNAERPETHRITPQAIEERGGYTYVIGYAHNRHAQRTYRLDRMEVPGTITAG